MELSLPCLNLDKAFILALFHFSFFCLDLDKTIVSAGVVNKKGMDTSTPSSSGQAAEAGTAVSPDGEKQK